MPTKVILFCGHLSNFGISSLEPILKNEEFELETIVLASEERWLKFKSALLGEPIRFNNKERKRNKQLVARIRRKIEGHAINIMLIENANSPDFYTKIDPKLIPVSVAFPQIFSRDFLNYFRNKGINFHPSYLPRCRGAHPVYWTIAAGEDSGGISCHLLTNKLDQGNLIARIKIPVDDEMDYDGLYAKIIENIPLLVSQVASYFRGEVAAFQQTGEASYYREDRWYHHKIYWEKESTLEILNKIKTGRAFINLGLINIGVKSGQLTGLKITNGYEDKLAPGTILKINKADNIIIKTIDDCIQVHLSLGSRSAFKRFMKRTILQFLVIRGKVVA